MTSRRGMEPEVTGRKILLQGHQTECRIGIHDFETAGPQPVIIDVELTLDSSRAPRGDEIASVVDYDFIRVVIAELTQGRTFNLQETLCEEIARRCLAPEGVRAVRVRSCKPDVYVDCEAVCYELCMAAPQG